jgi:hypothetical protein
MVVINFYGLKSLANFILHPICKYWCILECSKRLFIFLDKNFSLKKINLKIIIFLQII